MEGFVLLSQYLSDSLQPISQFSFVYGMVDTLLKYAIVNLVYAHYSQLLHFHILFIIIQYLKYKLMLFQKIIIINNEIKFIT